MKNLLLTLFTLFVLGCASIEGSKISLNKIQNPAQVSRLNLDYEITKNEENSEYKVVVEPQYSERGIPVPTVVLNTMPNETLEQIENRIKSYSKYNGNDIMNEVLFQQNTAYRAVFNGIDFKRYYKTSSFGGNIYKLSLNANTAYLMDKNGIKRYDSSKTEGCSVKISSGFDGGAGGYICSISGTISFFTAYILPRYCPLTYVSKANLVHNKTGEVLKNYLFKESADRIAWAPLLIFGKSQRFHDLNLADYSAQNKIFKALFSSISNDAATFSECQKQPNQNTTQTTKTNNQPKSPKPIK